MRQTYISEIRIALFIVSLPFLSGCSSSEALFDKANRKDHEMVMDKCSQMAPPVDASSDTFYVTPGETLTKSDTVTNTDTFEHYITKYITNTIRKTDTVNKIVNRTIVDRAKEYALQEANKKQQQVISDKDSTIASDKTKLHICYWIIGILGVYTIGRWVLRLTTGFKLP